jgi:hypothetical protein
VVVVRGKGVARSSSSDVVRVYCGDAMPLVWGYASFRGSMSCLFEPADHEEDLQSAAAESQYSKT